MSKHSCAACSMVRAGVKSRKALPHTCNPTSHSPIVYPSFTLEDLAIVYPSLLPAVEKAMERLNSNPVDDLERKFGI